MIHEFFEVFAAPVQMAEIPVEIRLRFRGGKLRRRFVERRDKGDAALECVAHGSVPFMRCSLGARRGKRNAGEGICHGSGDVGAWGRFFGHDGPEGRRLSCDIPCAGSMGNGRVCFRGVPQRHAGRGVRAEGGVRRGGRRCLCARRGDCRQAMSGDGAGSAEEVAAGGAVGVPCG